MRLANIYRTIYLPYVLLLLPVSVHAISTSNATKLAIDQTCPAMPRAAAGESYAFTLGYQKTPSLAHRSAHIWYDERRLPVQSPTVVFYWHGTDGTTDEIDMAFGKTGVQNLVRLGYIVVSPDHVRDAKGNGILKYSWYIANGSRLNHDIVFGDAIVECLNARFKTRFQVISAGCSAGAMQTALWSFQNADIVGIILYSGGIFRLPAFVPRPGFWAVITHGGAADRRGDFNFMNTAIHMHNQVLNLGHPSALCDFTPQGHDIHAPIANIFTQIILKPGETELPVQCSKKRH